MAFKLNGKKASRNEENRLVSLKDTNLTAFSGPQLLVLAAYLRGGAQRPIDTEDLAMQAFKLAPSRFSWRKYPDQINIETVRICASDAKKAKNGSMLRGTGNEGWMLTTGGLRWAECHIGDLKTLPIVRSRNSKEERILKAERNRLLASEAYQKLTENPGAVVTDREVETFFRIDSYISQNKREERIVRITNAFGEDLELGAIVHKLVNVVRTLSKKATA
ncbi:MAG: hypothetical protein QM703_02735 [Gemmatales bacterium]